MLSRNRTEVQSKHLTAPSPHQAALVSAESTVFLICTTKGASSFWCLKIYTHPFPRNVQSTSSARPQTPPLQQESKHDSELTTAPIVVTISRHWPPKRTSVLHYNTQANSNGATSQTFLDNIALRSHTTPAQIDSSKNSNASTQLVTQPYRILLHLWAGNAL